MMPTLDEQRSLNLKNSVYNTKNGRYVIGGSTEVSAAVVEWWNRTPIKRDPTDLVYFFEKKYEGRPEMLGYVFYGDSGMWWIIAQYNNILDPTFELVEGKLLLIPTAERVKADLISPNLKVGGIPTTRKTK
jgi:hypothetical protein